MASAARALVLGLLLWLDGAVAAVAADPGQQVLLLLRLAPRTCMTAAAMAAPIPTARVWPRVAASPSGWPASTALV